MARRGSRPRGADHDPQRTSHRAAHRDRAAGRHRLARAGTCDSTASIRSTSTVATRPPLRGPSSRWRRAWRHASKRSAAGDGRYPVQLPYSDRRRRSRASAFRARAPTARTICHSTAILASMTRRARPVQRAAHARFGSPRLSFDAAVAALQRHDAPGRPRERDHALRAPPGRVRRACPTDAGDAATGAQDASPMDAVDAYFRAIVKANPQLRPRVGNPDELRSNQHASDARSAQASRHTSPSPASPKRSTAPSSPRSTRRPWSARRSPTRAASISLSPTRPSRRRCSARCGRRSSSPGTSSEAGRRRAGSSCRSCDLAHLGERQERAVAPGPDDGRSPAGRNVGHRPRPVSRRRQ